jgi:cell division protein FtsN
MKKDVERKSYAIKQTASAKSTKRRWMLSSLVIITLCAAIIITSQYKKPSIVSAKLASYSMRIQNWIAERKNHLHQDIIKVQQIAANKNDNDQQIHFEFYTALPNMQVSVADLSARDDRSAPKVVAVKKTVNTAIINADQLERELNSEMKQSQYVVQLDVFKNAASAEQYRMTLSQAGLDANIVNAVIAGKNRFRVQVGPFGNKDQVRVAQRQMLKKGISGIVQKIE